DELLFPVHLDGGVLGGDGLLEGAGEVSAGHVDAAVAEFLVELGVGDFAAAVGDELGAAGGDGGDFGAGVGHHAPSGSQCAGSRLGASSAGVAGSGAGGGSGVQSQPLMPPLLGAVHV